nr:PDGLE domain-containing protein [Aldersonia kunmingensis]
MYLLRVTGRQRTGARRVSVNQFLIGFAVIAFAVAGLLSYLASSAPDGLDATTQRGCTVIENTERLEGECIAQRAEVHRFAASPLADYTINGNGALTGVAGILGVAAAFAALTATVRIVGARRRTPAG